MPGDARGGFPSPLEAAPRAAKRPRVARKHFRDLTRSPTDVTVWRRGPDDVWRVAVDIGCGSARLAATNPVR